MPWDQDRQNPTTILAQNLENMKMSFAVNGQAVPDEYILTYDHRPGDLDCRYAVVALSGWTPGESYLLEARRDILRAINDGVNNYPPGEYIRELKVTAQ